MSMNYPENLKYTKEHEWASLENDVVTIGITEFAQSSLGDIVFVELPELGKVLTEDEAFGVVESIKSVSDLYSPISGEVVAINEDVTDSPEKVNESPYKNWMIKIKLNDKAQFDSLLSSSEYATLCDG